MLWPMFSLPLSRRAVAFWVIYGGGAWGYDFFVVYKTRKNASPSDRARWQGQTLSEFVAALLANPKTRPLVVGGLAWNIAHFISLARHLHRGTTPGPLAMPFKSQRRARS